MMRNSGLRSSAPRAHPVEQTDTPFTNAAGNGQILKIPIAHSDGNYNCDDATACGAREDRQVIFRYTTPDGSDDNAGNPNGAVTQYRRNLQTAERNVAGLMPHPNAPWNRRWASNDGLVVPLHGTRSSAQPKAPLEKSSTTCVFTAGARYSASPAVSNSLHRKKMAPLAAKSE